MPSAGRNGGRWIFALLQREGPGSVFLKDVLQIFGQIQRAHTP